MAQDGKASTSGTAAPATGAPVTVAAVLGEIAWLMTQSSLHKQMFLSDLEWLVMPPLLLGQFRLFHGPGPSTGAVQLPHPLATGASASPPAHPTANGAGASPSAAAAQRPVGVVLWACVNDEVASRPAACACARRTGRAAIRSGWSR